MKLTLREQKILADLAEEVTPTIKRGRKPSDYYQTREQRLKRYREVGNLINRYEQWLKQN